ncbi:LysR family transcriptional regulator [Salinarimonas rosea]|uniref:LysR family transcriptional regulator n=1 Tax=Salinarimonas rosea TaxID=552063 RepID=UPI0004188AFE|nr:LysR family transcriptional regulator [Salinarimonas rosea]
MRFVTVQRLQVFCAVFEQGSVSAAARLLGLSQPTVSRHLRDFERAIGLPLFVLERGRIYPTAEAEGIYAESRFLGDGLDRLERSIAEVRTGQGRRYSITCVGLLAQLHLPRAIAELARRMPELEIDVDVGGAIQQLAALRAGRADIGIVAGSVDAPDLHATRIGEGRLVALLPAGHPWEGRAAVSQEEIAAEPRLIGMPLDRPIGRLVAHLAPADGAGGRERITASSLLAVPNLVRTLGRVSIVDEFTAEAATHVGVAAVPIAPPLVFEIQALSVRPLETRRAGPILVEALRELLAAR